MSHVRTRRSPKARRKDVVVAPTETCHPLSSSAPPGAHHGRPVVEVKGEAGEKVPMVSRCCQGPFREEASHEFSSLLFHQENVFPSSILGAVSQIPERSSFSPLSILTDSEDQKRFPQETLSPSLEPESGGEGGGRSPTGRRKMSASLGNDGGLGVRVKAKSKPPFLLSSKACAPCSQLNSTVFVKYVQEVSSGLINLRIWFLVCLFF